MPNQCLAHGNRRSPEDIGVGTAVEGRRGKVGDNKMKNIVKRENETLVFPRCRLTPNSLVIPENLTFDEWEQVGQTLRKIDGARLWWFGDWCNHGERKYGEKYTQAIEASDYEKQTLKNAAWISGKIESSRRRDNLSWSIHSEVAGLDLKDQDKWLDRAEEEGLTRSELRSLIRVERLKRETPELPSGKYRVIYADPPWPVDSMILDKWESPLDDKYQTMTIDEIKALNVEAIAADDCSLFLWTTHTYLREAFDVIEAWGFKYHCCITWDKASGWSLCGFHRMTEFCLYAYRGKINVNQSGEFIPTLIEEKKRKHSQKPDLMYKLIESNTPEPRTELFARIQRSGWASWGNQI